jgi:hypothetical protein
VNTEVYRFNVGDFECFAISDGTFVYEPLLISAPADFILTDWLLEDRGGNSSRCRKGLS